MFNEFREVKEIKGNLWEKLVKTILNYQKKF